MHVPHLSRSKPLFQLLTHTSAASMRTLLSFACRAPVATLAKHASVCQTSCSSPCSSILLHSYQTGYWRADKTRMSSVSPEESPVFNCNSLLTPSRDADSECVRLGLNAGGVGIWEVAIRLWVGEARVVMFSAPSRRTFSGPTFLLWWK